MKLKILLTLSLLISGQVFATHYSGTRYYFVQYHFSQMAFGKRVKAVLAHTALLHASCLHGDYWANIKDLEMKASGDHFNARATLSGSVDSGCEYGARAPIVQYFVTFEDGSQMVTNPAQVPVEYKGRFDDAAEAERSLKDAADDLESSPDSEGTESIAIEIGQVS